MRESLAILLLVHNCQSQLESLVAGLLEFAPDLSRWLELTIVDDGSNDGTEEIAWELATRYPQVDYLRHPFRLGRQECIRSGLLTTGCQYVLVCDADQPLDTEQVVRLWRGRDEAARTEISMSNHPVPAVPKAKSGRSKKWWQRQLVNYGQSRRRVPRVTPREAGTLLVSRSELAEAVGQSGHPRAGRLGDLPDNSYRWDRRSPAPPAAKLAARHTDSPANSLPGSPSDFQAALDRLKEGAGGG